MWCFLLLTLFVTVQGRAVNISNTWVLPEEGFPVFYRYFRDRISWYEADAVCQFHHANLVTVDTTAQYDAVRAYLKELDISSAVWVGLIRSNPDGDFTWTDYRGLSGDGYWSAAPDTRSAPLCAAADPAADYRWEARACGGPSVASFICELPVPQWALGNEGCMVRALPAVTVLYLPESAAVQLTADCGLAGVKRVQCTGNMKRDELLKELACSEEDQTSVSPNGTSPITLFQSTTDSIFTNQDTNNEVSTEENVTTEHEDDINQSTSIKVISTSYSIIPDVSNRLSPKPFSTKKLFKIPLYKNVDLDVITSNNLQNNETPKQDRSDDFFTNEQSEKLEDVKLQHTKLHDELARLGNLETVFSQPTDHFVPPLVMAKAKMTDDMTALSIEEKIAQQLAEHPFIKHNNRTDNISVNNINKELYSTVALNSTLTTALPTNLITSLKGNNNEQTGDIMHTLPKKYNKKYNDVKYKILKNYVPKIFDPLEAEITSTSSKLSTKDNDMTSTSKTITEHTHIDIYPTKSHLAEEATLELTVIIKDPPKNKSNDVNVMATEKPLFLNTTISLKSGKYNEKEVTSSLQNISLTTTPNEPIKTDVIDIHVFNFQGNHSNTLDVTTGIPIYKNTTEHNAKNVDNDTLSKKSTTVFTVINRNNPTTITVNSTASSIHYLIENFTTTDGMFQTTSDLISKDAGELDSDLNVNTTSLNIGKSYNISENTMSPSKDDLIKDTFDSIIDSDFDLERNNTDTPTAIDDFQSPLLSGASEPLHKPNRSRRPQQQNRNKFNPFRILG